MSYDVYSNGEKRRYLVTPDDLEERIRDAITSGIITRDWLHFHIDNLIVKVLFAFFRHARLRSEDKNEVYFFEWARKLTQYSLKYEFGRERPTAVMALEAAKLCMEADNARSIERYPSFYTGTEPFEVNPKTPEPVSLCIQEYTETYYIDKWYIAHRVANASLEMENPINVLTDHIRVIRDMFLLLDDLTNTADIEPQLFSDLLFEKEDVNDYGIPKIIHKNNKYTSIYSVYARKVKQRKGIADNHYALQTYCRFSRDGMKIGSAACEQCPWFKEHDSKKQRVLCAIPNDLYNREINKRH